MIIEKMKEQHQSDGAIFNNIVVDNYGELLKEYESLKNNVGLIDLSYRGKLVVKGKDRFNYLQGLITNDIMNCPVNEGVYATLLNVKGKMLYDMYIYKDEEQLLVETNGDQAESLKEHLLKMKFMAEIEVENISDNYGLFSIQGPKSFDIINSTFGVNFLESKELTLNSVSWNGNTVYLCKLRRSDFGGVDIYINENSAPELWSKLKAFIKEADGAIYGNQVLEITRVEAGIPLYGIDLTEDYNPLEAGLEERAVHFNKGCYTGQEAVARMKYRGHSNWSFRGLKIDIKDFDHIEPLIKIDDKDVAKIKSAVYSPGFKQTLALTYIRKEYQEEGTELPVTINGKERTAKVTSLPFSNS